MSEAAPLRNNPQPYAMDSVLSRELTHNASRNLKWQPPPVLVELLWLWLPINEQAASSETA